MKRSSGCSVFNMSVAAVCVLGVFAVLSALAIKSYNKDIAAVLIIATVVLTALSIIPQISSALNTIEELSDLSGVPQEYFSVLLKSIGICCITQLSSNICKENGSASIASQIELTGKIMIVVLALPLYTDILEMIAEFL